MTLPYFFINWLGLFHYSWNYFLDLNEDMPHFILNKNDTGTGWEKFFIFFDKYFFLFLVGTIEIIFYPKAGASKVGCIFPMVIISAEFGPAEFGPNGHLEDASHFTISNIEFWSIFYFGYCLIIWSGSKILRPSHDRASEELKSGSKFSSSIVSGRRKILVRFFEMPINWKPVILLATKYWPAYWPKNDFKANRIILVSPT